jgi:transcriptional regulator with XRE-family HTH domain
MHTHQAAPAGPMRHARDRALATARARRRLRPRTSVGARIAQLRTALHLTQQQLAARAKTYQTRISKLESGSLDFRISTLTAIAEALGAEVEIDLVTLAAATAPILVLQTDLEQELFSTVHYRVDTGDVTAQTFREGADSVVGRSRV